MKLFLRFGLLTGIVNGIWAIGSFTLIGLLNRTLLNNTLPAERIRAFGGLFSIIILAFGIGLGMREVRRRNQNRLTYAQAIKTGIGIACITALFGAFSAWLYCSVINPGYTGFMV